MALFRIICSRNITLYLLVSSADNLCKQFGPRPGPTSCRARPGSKLFDTLMVLKTLSGPERILEKVDFEKKSADDKKA